MVSRDGWVVYDDSPNYILDANDWWVPNANGSGTRQNGDALDLYGFFHGHDYAGALQDFTGISGKTIMVRAIHLGDQLGAAYPPAHAGATIC